MLSDLGRAELKRDWEEMHHGTGVNQVVLERIKVVCTETPASGVLDDARVRTSEHLSFLADGLAAQLIARVTAQNLGDETVRLEVNTPSDWWQHLKERWFPAWARRRWPVLYTTKFQSVELKRYMLYPDFPLPGHKGYATVIPGPVFTESDDA